MAVIAVAFEHRPVGVGFKKLHLGIKMAAVAHRVRLAFLHPVKIRPMGIVAGIAFTLDKRLVLHKVFGRLLGFLVACQAQGLSLGAQQIFVGAGMLDMTGKAALIIGYGLMGNLQLLFFCCMTLKTQIVAGFG